MLKGRVILDNFSDLYLNLAIEHVLLDAQATSDYVLSVRFWQNPKSVILGRGQYIKQEVNAEYCKENGIQVARRLSGGGTVYQDEGNLNISFFVDQRIFADLKNITKIRKIFTKIFHDTLFEQGFNCFEKEYNLYFHQKKISGSAGHLTSKSFLHHATLLFNANLEHLERSLLASHTNSSSKRVSNYEPTINLQKFDKIKFQQLLIKNISYYFNLYIEKQNITVIELKKAEKLKNYIYKNSSWINHGKREKLNT